ncbi:thiamine pyrophosphate-dependent enzyme [Hyalangium minutum]|uniref:2-oxoisovalerate dehydrogenase subunit alpha n=1 Tax=Hyalangium minutum TaxID=394096 RepID=A0A085VTU9_9BACT|nr:thiamine pyrophosphate-dependent enzyme [Hyalangium minutum]KFE58862.1 Branched-chain alpha-keto acid dehydrogenase, E1 component, alpha subunit protein [Hyalangium minutum]
MKPGNADPADASLPEGVDEALALELYRQMVFLRIFDERALVYHRHGRIGTWAISWGHEAIQVGAMLALKASDWAFPSYRENKLGLVRGMSPAHVLAGCRGHPQGWWDPHQWRLGAISIPVASHVPHAAGFAWGERLQGRDTVALSFFGDGATSQGEFHEGANMAGVMNAPLILLCTNNQWAISTPVHRQTRARTLADKAAGYGMLGVRVDGNDVLAVYQAVSQAAARARAGEGPTFIECLIYRAQAHAFPDDPSAYRDDTEAEQARREECVGRYANLLMRRGLLTEELAARYREEFLAKMADAIAEAEALPIPGPELAFAHAYERKTPALERDLSELQRIQAKQGTR